MSQSPLYFRHKIRLLKPYKIYVSHGAISNSDSQLIKTSSSTLTAHNYTKITHSAGHPRTCMRSHVPLQQRGPVKGFGAHAAGQQRPFPGSRPRSGHPRLWEVALRAGRGTIAGNGFSLVLGRRWRSREDARQEGHREVQRRICELKDIL